MAIVRFTCPECDEEFKVGAAPAPGKKVKCPECKHAFVPPAEDDEEEDEEEPPTKAKPSAKKAAAKNRSRDDEDDEEEEEDEDEEDDAPRRKKKKKSAGINVLYWVYRGVSILVLLILLGVLAYIWLFRKTSLNHETVVPLSPLETRYTTIDPTNKGQDVNINAQASSGQFDIYVFLEKDKVEADAAIAARKPSAKILASQLKTQAANLKISVPANESATVGLLSADGKRAEVKLKFTN